MRIRAAFLGLGFALAGPAASAENLYSYVDAYYIPDTEIEVDAGSLGSASTSGDGFGVKGAVDLSRGLFLAAEWDRLQFDDGGDSEVDFWRAGLGMYMGWGPTNGFYGYGEYIRLEENDSSSDSKNDGYGAHVGFQSLILPSLGGRIQGGYASLDLDNDGGELKGPEYLASLNLAVTELISLVAEYRYSDFEAESNSGGGSADFTISEFRTGARFSFGH